MAAPDRACVIAVDAGTTGVRALAVDQAGAVVDVSYRELVQHYPQPGWVEHDAAEIWDHVRSTTAEVARRQHESGRPVAAVGITNQRETVVAWDRRTGAPRHRALVWQDRRTAAACDRLNADGHLDEVRRLTGLVLDPYFSATKMAWLLGEGAVGADDDLVLGTVDTWVAWNLTGGPHGGALVTDPSNASRTLLYDINERRWSDDLGALFGIPLRHLPDVVPTCGRVGTVAGALASEPALAGVPVSAMAGDQQSALFGQACFAPGMAKVTYGTGSFVLCNIGTSPPAPAQGLLTTVAWDLGDHGRGAPAFAYALEGAVFVTGAAIQWLRDGLGIISEAADIGPLASQVPNSEGVFVVPAFTGMGSPRWDPYARGTIVGLSRGLGRAHVARAVVEAMALQVRDVVDTMRSAGTPVEMLKVDGGAAVMDLLLQIQADQLRIPVRRPSTTETTALGAATLAGLAEGVWSLSALEDMWALDAAFEPVASQVAADALHGGWMRAVERAAGWATSAAD